MQLESIEQIGSYAAKVFDGLDQVINKIYIKSILNCYINFCNLHGEGGIAERPISNETLTRLRLECLCFSGCIAGEFSKEYIERKNWSLFSNNRLAHNVGFGLIIYEAFLQSCISESKIQIQAIPGLADNIETEITVDRTFAPVDDGTFVAGDFPDLEVLWCKYLETFTSMKEHISLYDIHSPTLMYPSLELFGAAIGNIFDTQYSQQIGLHVGQKMGRRVPVFTMKIMKDIFSNQFNIDEYNHLEVQRCNE